MIRTAAEPATLSPTAHASTRSTTESLAVSACGLRKSFGSLVAVDDLDLTVRPGEVVAFLGPNGAGKSTTLDMILGLTRPDAGQVQLLGTSPDQAVRSGRAGVILDCIRQSKICAIHRSGCKKCVPVCSAMLDRLPCVILLMKL